jgi:hypothetical protein
MLSSCSPRLDNTYPMSKGLGRWQRAALNLLSERGEDMLFATIARSLGAVTLSERIALRRALERLTAAGRLSKRAGKQMFGGSRDIVWRAVDPPENPS